MHRFEGALKLLVVVILVLTATIGSAPTARAQVWAEFGDAGNLVPSAQTTLGSGALLTITGTFANVEDADVYCIYVPDPAAFTAGIQCLVMTDPDIWIFDPNGIGLTHQDACSAGDTDVSGTFLPGPGTYYLAVAHGGRQAQGPAGAIWLTQLFNPTERPPDGPGAPGPLTGWAGGGQPTTLTSYIIRLQGANYCGTVLPVSDATWGAVKVLYR